jgi:hypothetical protein
MKMAHLRIGLAADSRQAELRRQIGIALMRIVGVPCCWVTIVSKGRMVALM